MQIESKTVETDLFQDDTRLFEKVCNPFWLSLGFGDVKRNGGAPGVDGTTIDAFEGKLDQELARLSEDIESWRYKPEPVRGVEIPKPGGGVRQLGVPTVRDRVVHATLKRALEPILLPHFSDHSYGFIAGRNQEQAVKEAQRIVKSGKPWVVDIDLSKFFDRVNHDRLIHRLGQHIPDKRILRLVGTLLRGGVMKDGLVNPTPEGTIQGSPLSPLLSNVVLDELDKELERRNLEFCRFADDCNIFVKTPKAAERVMQNISGFIEKKLRLKVNTEKSKVARSEEVTFLGMTIVEGSCAISRRSLKRAMAKVKELTPRGTHHTLEQTIESVNQWYRGWSSYYSMTQYPSQLQRVEAHIRRRLRSRLVDQQKSRRNLLRKLLKQGVEKGWARRTAYSNKRRWALSRTQAVERAFPNHWFLENGMFIRSTAKLKHWFDIDVWIRLM